MFKTKLLEILNCENPRKIARPVKIFIFFTATVFFGFQQVSFYHTESQTKNVYYNSFNNGARYTIYFPFFYCKNMFPVFINSPAASCATVDKIIQEQPEKLSVPELLYNRSSVYLFFPDMWLHPNKNLDHASMTIGEAWYFTAGILSLFGIFLIFDHAVIGFIMSQLIACDAFQVSELYYQFGTTNIFPLVIASGVWVLAGVALLLFLGKKHRHFFKVTMVTCLALGVLYGLQKDLRIEGIGSFLGFIVFLLLLPKIKFPRKAFLVASLVIASTATFNLLNKHLDYIFEKSNHYVERIGGNYAKQHLPSNYAMHYEALWEGLGDFDETHGYLADDRAAYSYYYGHTHGESVETLLRNDIFYRILHNPAWFFHILYKRTERILFDNTPFRLRYGSRCFDLPLSPLLNTLLFLLGTGFMLSHKKYEIPLFVFISLSIASVSVGQMADYGLELYSITHLIIASFILFWAYGILEFLIRYFLKLNQLQNCALEATS